MQERQAIEIVQSIAGDQTAIIYDGECPFCANFVALTRLRESIGPIALIDARTTPHLSKSLLSNGYNLDEGMLVRHQKSLFLAPMQFHNSQS